MNTPLDRSHGAKLCLIVVTSLLVCPGLVGAAELKEARVTQVVKDVKLLPETAAPRPAAVNDPVHNDTAVRTGLESRTELTFTDQTLARLGANTIFSFAEGTRSLDLKDGAMLLRVPKNSGGAKINTAAISAAITGTTVMIETHPVTTKTKGGFYKFIVLEGTARLFLPGHMGESVLVHAGQMIIMRPDGKKIPNPVDVDISKIMQSSLLITGFAPLPSAPLIALQEQQQNTLKSSGQLYDTNLVIFGGGTGVSVTDPTNTNAVSVATTAQSSSSSPPPTPPPPPPPSSKFGALSVITSPDPFVINSGTTIQTDPTITANGQTYFGKIWRGPSIDGPLSVYAFGSTSAFDSASGFDTRVIGNTNGAAFKFNSLQLTGNPTVSTTNGAINLGLFAINGITSGAPGGTLTFAGIHGLLLATQNGSIDLGSEISFSGLHDLILYARGANSDLTLSSAISAVTNTTLIAQRDVNIDGTTLGVQALAVIAGQNIDMGGSSPVTINGSEASLLIPNSGTGNIAGDATITLNPAGNLTLNGANGLSLLIDNSNGGHIGGSASISLNTVDLTAGSLNLFINNRNGGSIGSSAVVVCNVLGNLTIAGDANIGTSNRNDGLGGGTMGSDSTVTVLAMGSISVGGVLSGFVSANAGGHIGGIGSLQLSTPGDIHSGGGTSLLVQSTGFNIVPGPFIAPGLISSDALLNVTAANLTSDGFIDAEVGEAGGRIGGNAGLSVNIADAISSPDTEFLVGGVIGGLGGQIGGNASVVVNASSISGSTTGPFFQIVNGDGGSIGGSAAIDVTAASLSGHGLFVAILNSINDGGATGTIGSNAAINFNISGTSTIANNATFQINGSDAVSGTAAIDINGGTYNVGGTFEGFMDGKGTFTLNNATIAADTVKVGVFGTNGTLRIGGGSISANTLLHLYATGSNGLIDFVSKVTLNGGGAAAVIAANTVTVENGVVVTIAGSTPANVFTNNANYTGSGGNGSTSGTFGVVAGATTQPLGGQPPFVVAAATTRSANKASLSSSSGGGRKGPMIHVSDTSELASLLDHAAVGGDGKARMPSGSRNRNASVQPKARIAAPASNPIRNADARFATVALHAQ